MIKPYYPLNPKLHRKIWNLLQGGLSCNCFYCNNYICQINLFDIDNQFTRLSKIIAKMNYNQ